MNALSSQPSTSVLEEWLSLAGEAARSAGEFLAGARIADLKIGASLGKDIKLAVDRESEDRIIGMLRERSDFPILSEEQGMIKGRMAEQDWRWVVDPLDGSLNYLRGIPLCCVSVGLWHGDSPMLGAIYDFNRNELFTGLVGCGAWLNGAAIMVSTTQAPGEAVLCAGFPVGTDLSPAALQTFVEQVRQYKKVRLFGAAALSLAYVAAGRVDAYYERDIWLWDVAAGLAIVLAAGGAVIKRPSSASPDALVLCASTPALQAFLQL